MTNTAATEAQISYIRKLQEQNGWLRTHEVAPITMEDRARAVSWTQDDRTSEGYRIAKAWSDANREAPKATASITDRKERRAKIIELTAEPKAALDAFLMNLATEKHAARVAALDVDPTTLTKAEASALIDLIKG